MTFNPFTIEGAGILVLMIASTLTIRFVLAGRRRRVPAALAVAALWMSSAGCSRWVSRRRTCSESSERLS